MRLFLPARSFDAFGPALLLILPAGSAALRNGQATTLMLAMMLFATLAIAERRWWRAAAWLALGFAIKPLTAVLLLLAAVLYRPLAGRILLCVISVLLLPLLHPHPSAAWHLYGLCLSKLFTAATPGPGGWSGTPAPPAGPRPPPPPPVYYAPAPVYVEEPACRLVRERFWDGYGWQVRRVQVCD